MDDHLTHSVCMAAGLQTHAVMTDCRGSNGLGDVATDETAQTRLPHCRNEDEGISTGDKVGPHAPSVLIMRLLTAAMQVTFETTSEGKDVEGLPSPVWLQMHGAEGVSPPLQFDPNQAAGLAVYERNAEACGELSQLTVWLQPIAVSRPLSKK